MFRFALVIVFGFLVSLPLKAEEPVKEMPSKMFAYFGTGDKNVYVYSLNMKTGELSEVAKPTTVSRPSFLALHPSGDFLYAVCRVPVEKPAPDGGVTAMRIDKPTGKLTIIDQQASGGNGPCHLVVDATGSNVLAAHYGSGSVVSIPIAGDGTLSDPVSLIQHEGSSVNPKRQTAPHAHSINMSPDNRFAFAADLGLDKVLVYRLDGETGKLMANDPPSVKVAPGAGPRHFSFHPSGKFAFVINELASTITTFAYDTEKGVLTETQTITTLPADFTETNSTAEVLVHPSGKFVYGSNRGHNSIAAFSFDDKSGKLTPLEHESTQGEIPRNFGIDPTGTFLIACNQKTGNVAVLRIAADGSLSPTGHGVEMPAPMCVKFLAR